MAVGAKRHIPGLVRSVFSRLQRKWFDLTKAVNLVQKLDSIGFLIVDSR